jgi:hypothetical protein
MNILKNLKTREQNREERYRRQVILKEMERKKYQRFSGIKRKSKRIFE